MTWPIAYHVSFPKLCYHFTHSSKSILPNSFLNNSSFLITRHYTCFYWFRTLTEVQYYTNRHICVCAFSHPVMSNSVTPWIAARQAVPHHLLEFA